MQYKLLKLIMDISKYSVYIMLIQIVTLQFVSANETNGQSLKETQVSISVKNASLEDIISLIENQTDFVFTAEGLMVGTDSRIDLKLKKSDLKTVLNRLSGEFEYNFKRVNKNIYVWKAEKDAALPIEETMADVDITGKITDENGEGLPGVSVIEKGTTNGTTTDLSGNYKLNLPENASLVISFVGYKTTEIQLSGRSTVDVQMELDAEQLEEVVVIGYGEVKKSDLTGSISTVSSKDFEKQPLFRTEDALQGRAAGVQVLKNSGAPGGNIKVRIRGSNSITGNNDPLVVVDGIIGGDLASINTNDIESLEILKDASASAIYGSRGANGVILITTKKGETTAKVDVNYFVGVSNVPKKISLMNPEQFANLTGSSVIDDGVDYQDLYFQTATTNNLQLSTSGKEGNISYFLSGNYVDQEGTVTDTNYERFSLRSNLSAEVSEKLSVGLNLYGSREHSFNLVNGGTRASPDTRGGITNVLAFDPTLPVRNANGDFNLQSNNGSILVNPLAVQNTRDGNIFEDRINSNLNVSYDISKSFNFTILAGGSISNVNTETFEAIPAGSSVLPPGASSGSMRTSSYQVSNILSWKKDLGESNIKLTGIYEIQSEEIAVTNLNSRQYALSDVLNAFYLLELGQSQTVNADYLKSNLQSYIGRAEYGFKNQLFFTGTIRVDKSSRFRDKNRAGIFPSLSASYNLSDAGFVKSSGFLDNIKLRAGYGETGNQDIAPYSTFATLNTGRDFPFNGSSLNIGLSQGNPVDENLTWETTKQFNAGVDFALLESRINLSLDWYNKNTTDLLLDLPVAQFAGGGTLRTNLGEVRNTGLDINLSGIIVDKAEFQWDASANVSFVNNEVVSLGGLEQILLRPVNPGGTDANLYIIEEGEPLGQFYGATFLGTWKSGDSANGTPGSARYATDASGANTLGVIGNGTPNLTWGLNNNLTYKGLDLNFLIRGVQGFEVLNATRGIISLGGGDVTVPTHADYLNRWTAQNETDIPASGTNVIASSRYIENGSFIRLSNVTLGYTLPAINGVRSLKVYVSAQNLITITDYTGFDPEVSATGTSSNDASPSLDFGAFPNPRTFTFGINVGF